MLDTIAGEFILSRPCWGNEKAEVKSQHKAWPDKYEFQILHGIPREKGNNRGNENTIIYRRILSACML
jgi:hypothetical protein